MIRLLPFLLVCAVMLVVLSSREYLSAKDNNSREGALPVGRWTVEFANGVTEVCSIGNGGEASVEETQRRSHGMAVVKADSVVITFNDDRVERWTPVGKHFVVEHWFPGSGFPQLRYSASPTAPREADGRTRRCT